MGLTERLDRFQQRHPRAGLPLAVAYKFVDDQGGYLSALLTYYGFLSLFPLLLLLSTILNFALHNDPQLQERVVHSALGQFPVIGDQLARTQTHGVSGSGVALVVGIMGTLYGALGVAQAAQNMMNVAWMVPRNVRPNPLMGRLRGLLLLAVVGVAVAGTTVLSALGGSAHSFGATIGLGVKILLVVASVLVNAAVFTVAFKVATVKDVAWREVLAGAILAAVVWQILQSFGTAYVGHVVKNASATNSVFALVLGLIAWIYLESVVVVLAVEVNVVRTLRLYPRALLTPFTDDVDLTHADESAYRGQAQAQRAKSFQDIDVTFDEQPDRQD
jgi:membrane protein